MSLEGLRLLSVCWVLSSLCVKPVCVLFLPSSGRTEWRSCRDGLKDTSSMLANWRCVCAICRAPITRVFHWCLYAMPLDSIQSCCSHSPIHTVCVCMRVSASVSRHTQTHCMEWYLLIIINYVYVCISLLCRL